MRTALRVAGWLFMGLLAVVVILVLMQGLSGLPPLDLSDTCRGRC